MRIVFRPRAAADLRWLRRYGARFFPHGREAGLRRFEAVQRLLRERPEAGHPTGVADVREASIPLTPFTVLYRVRDQGIEVLRVRDERADPTRKARPLSSIVPLGVV